MTRGLDEADISFVERLAVAASLHRPDGTFVYLNSAGERASGIKYERLRGRNHLYLVPEEARGHVDSLFKRALQGETTDFETVFTDGEGRLRGVRASHLPLKDGDEVVGVLVLAFDVKQPPEPGSLAHPPTLTRRQLEILELMADGLSTAEIAAQLSLSVETVRNHIRGVLRELNTHSRVEAVAAARRLGLLSPRAYEANG